MKYVIKMATELKLWVMMMFMIMIMKRSKLQSLGFKFRRMALKRSG